MRRPQCAPPPPLRCGAGGRRRGAFGAGRRRGDAAARAGARRSGTAGRSSVSSKPSCSAVSPRVTAYACTSSLGLVADAAARGDETRLVVTRVAQRSLVLLGLERRVLDRRAGERASRRRPPRRAARRCGRSSRRSAAAAAPRAARRARRLRGALPTAAPRRARRPLAAAAPRRSRPRRRGGPAAAHVRRGDRVLERLRRQRAPGAAGSAFGRGAGAVLRCALLVRALAEHVQTGSGPGAPGSFPEGDRVSDRRAC